MTVPIVSHTARDVRELVYQLLERHQPVDGHPDHIRFQLEPTACMCGDWSGFGSCFNDHRAQVIAHAIAGTEPK